MAQIIKSRDKDIKKINYIHIHVFKEVEKSKSMFGGAMETDPNVLYR